MAGDERAHAAVAMAIRRGQLPSASSQPCSDCRGPATAYHHFLGYAPEHWLSVVAVCGRCHSRRHAEGGPRKRRPTEPTGLVSVRMPEDLHQELRRFARSDDSTVNRSIIVAVRRYLRQMKARQPKGGEDAR